MNPLPTAVIFDVGGVLIRAPQLAIAAYEEELGIRNYRGLIARAIASGAPDNGFCRLERGELTLSQFVPVFDREVSVVARDEGEGLANGFSTLELFRRITDSYQPCQEMLDAAFKLRQRGLKTCVVTNNWTDDIFSHSFSLPSPLFDCILESSKLGIRKPDPEIYHLACQSLGVSPKQVVFLDDLGVNLKSARSLGIKTIKVTQPMLALKELEKLCGFNLTNSKL